MAALTVTADNPLTLAPATEAEEIMQNISTIMRTVRGSVPLDRDLGVDFSPLDLPAPEAMLRWRMELIEAIERDESRVKVRQVELIKDHSDGAEGKLSPRVTVEIVA